MLDLKALQAAIAPAHNENSGQSSFGNYYPFWSMKDGEQCTIRFLPDANPDNPLGFLLEKLTHKLEVNGTTKKVPCLSMFGEECPICKVSQEFYNEKNDPAQGKKYWRQKQHLTQALIVEDPLPPGEHGETYEGTVRSVVLGYQIFNIIKDAFESGDLDEIPYAYEGGCDFIIKKTPQGDWSTYTVGTKFARRSSDLTKKEIANVEEHIVDLSTLLPKKPNLDEVNAMLAASLNGGNYNPAQSKTNTNTVSTQVENILATDTDTPVEVATPVSNVDVDDDDSLDAEAEELMARIKSRKK